MSDEHERQRRIDAEVIAMLVEALTELLGEAEEGIATCPLTRQKSRRALRQAQEWCLLCRLESLGPQATKVQTPDS
jgi:hypothetical protein